MIRTHIYTDEEEGQLEIIPDDVTTHLIDLFSANATEKQSYSQIASISNQEAGSTYIEK